MNQIIADASIWGDIIPSWLSAIGTVGALWAALWLLREDLRDRRANRRGDRERTARRIAGWCDTISQPARLWVQNLAEEPVYDAVAYVGKRGTDLSALPEPENMYMEVVFGMVPPGQKLDCEISESAMTSGAQFPDIPAVAVEFTDAGGVHWRRIESGTLREIAHRRPFD
jgi:hypothetical protein